MNTVSIQQLHIQVDNLQKELGLLRSTLISLLGKDKEGEYNPEFVERILNAIKEKPTYTFTNASAFLSHLEKI